MNDYVLCGIIGFAAGFITAWAIALGLAVWSTLYTREVCDVCNEDVIRSTSEGGEKI